MVSSVTGLSRGAPSWIQSGSSSFNAFGSKIAPDRMCAPISEPFSTRQIEISRSASRESCASRMAAESPAGPPPTIRTSNSMDSRWSTSVIVDHRPSPVGD